MAVESVIRTPSLRVVVGLLGLIFTLLTLASWSVASPVGSSPDDDFHLASLWCAEGDRPNLCESTPGTTAQAVPRALAQSARCFAFRADQSAACQDLTLTNTPADLTVVTHINSIHLYPPIFYAADGLFASQNPELSVVSMRLFNSVLAVTMLLLLYLLLPRNLRHLPLWAAAVTCVPLGIFIIPSTNPSSWAVISACVLLYALLGYMQTQGRRQYALATLAVVATFVGAGSRGDAGLYSIIAVAASLLIGWSKEKHSWKTLVVPTIIVLISAFFFFSTSQAGQAAGGLEGAADSSIPLWLLVAKNLIMTPLIWWGVFGSWGLGWLDTILPAVVSYSTLSALFLIAVLGVWRLRQRTLLAALLILAAMWAIPTYVLVRSHAFVGSLVQPRYLLPLIIMFVGVLVYREAGSGRAWSQVSRWAALLLLAGANSIALHTNLRRYITGTDVVNWNLNEKVEWWWSSLPVDPMQIWVTGSLAFFIALVSLTLLSPRHGWGVGAVPPVYVGSAWLTKRISPAKSRLGKPV